MADNFSLAVILSAIDRLSGPFKKSEEAIKRLNLVAAKAREIERLGTRLSLAGAFATGAAAQMSNLITSMTAPAIALDTAAHKISSMPGITNDAVNRIVAAGRRWSKEHVATADQFVETSYTMLSAGLDESQAIAATRAGLSLATAAIGEQGDAANLLAVIYNNMGDKTRDVNTEMTRLADIVARTQQIFQIKDLAQLSEGLKMATPAALGAGVAIEQTTAIVGQLNSAGMQGSMAGTAFSATLRNMIPASRALGFEIKRNANGSLDYLGTLESMSKRFGDLNKLTDMQRVALQKAFGDEGLRAVQLLLPKLKDLRGNLDGVRNSSGAVAEAQRKIEESVANRMQIAKNNLDEFKTAFATQLLPVITAALPKITALLEKFTAFAEAHPGIVKIAAGLALAGTALLAIAGPVLTVAGGFVLFSATALGMAGAVDRISRAVGVLKSGLGKTLPMLGKAGLVGAAGAAGYTAGSVIHEKFIKGTFFDRILGEKIAQVAAFFGNEEAKSALESNRRREQMQGTLNIKIDAEGRARVTQLRAKNGLDIDVDTGPMMVTP